MESGGDSSISKNLGLWRWREGTVPVPLLPAPTFFSISKSPAPTLQPPVLRGERGLGNTSGPIDTLILKESEGHGASTPSLVSHAPYSAQGRGGRSGEGGGVVAAADLMSLLGLCSQGRSQGSFDSVRCARGPFHSFLWGVDF